MQTLFLPWLYAMNVPLGPPRTRLRVGSPRGGSTLITSAPSCERMWLAKGAASIVPSSMTRRPVRGGVDMQFEPKRMHSTFRLWGLGRRTAKDKPAFPDGSYQIQCILTSSDCQ